MPIEWTKQGNEWSEPSGRFLIVETNRRYELAEAEVGSVMRRASKAACMARAEEMAATANLQKSIIDLALEKGTAKIFADPELGKVDPNMPLSLKAEADKIASAQEPVDPRKEGQKLREIARQVNADPTQTIYYVIDGDPEFPPRVADGETIPEEKTDNKNEEQEMKTLAVPEKVSREMLVDAGFTGSDAIKVEKLVNRLNRLKEADDETLKAAGKRHAKLRDAILKALATGRSIILEEGKAETNGHVKTIKNAPSVKAEKKTPAKKVKAESNGEAVGTDKFGTRLGTKQAAINAILSKKPKKMKQIMEEAGMEESFYNYCNALVKEGYVVKTDDGYALASKS